jgi:hypothetical protein
MHAIICDLLVYDALLYNSLIGGSPFRDPPISDPLVSDPLVSDPLVAIQHRRQPTLPNRHPRTCSAICDRFETGPIQIHPVIPSVSAGIAGSASDVLETPGAAARCFSYDKAQIRRPFLPTAG